MNILCTTTISGVLLPIVSATKHDVVRTAQIGKPRIAVTAKVINKYVAIIQQPPSSLLVY